MWLEDNVVVPKESEWFGVWDSNRDVVYLKQQEIWTEDTIGLKELYDAGKMFFYAGPGDHMHLENYMMTDYLAPLLLDQTPKPSAY